MLCRKYVILIGYSEKQANYVHSVINQLDDRQLIGQAIYS